MDFDFANIGSLGVAIVALLISAWNTSKKDSKEDTMQITSMMLKLDSISEDIRDVKKDVADMRANIQDNHDRILKLEMSLNTAWVRIDELRGTTDRAKAKKE